MSYMFLYFFLNVFRLQVQSQDEITESRATNYKSTTAIRPTKSANEPGKPRVLPDQAVLHKQMSEMMLQFTKHPSGARVKTLTRSQIVNNPTLRSSTQNLNMASSTYPTLTSSSRSRMTYDVLENHSSKFTAPDQLFQPRINKRSSAKSKLATDLNASYQPPRSRANSARSSVVSTARTNNNYDQGEFMNGSMARRKSPNKSAKSFEDDDDDDDEEEEDNAEYLNKYKNKMNHSGLNESVANKSLNNSRNYSVAAVIPTSKSSSRPSQARSNEK
jgi:hypothetical protein